MRSKLVEPRAAKLLSESQELRNSTKKLMIRYWEQYDGFYLTDEQKKQFMSVTPPGSITRARRNLKATYPTSKETDDADYNRFKEELNDHSTYEQQMAEIVKPRIETINGEQVVVI